MVSPYSQEITITAYDNYVQAFIGIFDSFGYGNSSSMNRMDRIEIKKTGAPSRTSDTGYDYRIFLRKIQFFHSQAHKFQDNSIAATRTPLCG